MAATLHGTCDKYTVGWITSQKKRSQSSVPSVYIHLPMLLHCTVQCTSAVVVGVPVCIHVLSESLSGTECWQPTNGYILHRNLSQDCHGAEKCKYNVCAVRIAPRQSDCLCHAISSKLAGVIFIANCVICWATMSYNFNINKSLLKWFWHCVFIISKKDVTKKVGSICAVRKYIC